ncbi:MAG: FtsX-like permease family protein, partial [Bacteroidota bacterium]
FGLASLNVTQRTKEIGIRKVLGATIPGILSMFTKEFLMLIVTANIIAVPVSYIALNAWLQNFAYRTNIGVDIFIGTAAITLLIASIAISVQAIKTAMANPVESLRYE